MPVLVEDPCRLLVQGLGRDGSFQAQRILEYGTNMVAAVHPNRGGTKFMDQVPYFETAREAVTATGANTGLVFVPAPFATTPSSNKPTPEYPSSSPSPKAYPSRT